MEKTSNKKKKILLSVVIILMILLLAGVTYAAFSVALNIVNGNIKYNTAMCFDIGYDITNEDGTMSIEGTLKPSNTYSEGLSGRVSIGIDPDCASDVLALGNIYLNISDTNTITNLTKTVKGHCENNVTLESMTDYKNYSQCMSARDGIWVTNGSALKYLVYDVEINDVVSSGYIGNLEEVVNLYKEFSLSYNYDEITGEWSPRDYDIYIWLDGNLIDNSYYASTFTGYISANANQVNASNAPTPKLDSNMVPVVISADGTVTTVSKDDSAWYDYRYQKWANAVAVTSSSRNTYLNSSGVTVNPSHILAYYVWIPRYKYKIWTIGESVPLSIEIMFESDMMAPVYGESVGEYKTHPAFLWDDNNNGTIEEDEVLSGIWVGKFETSTLSSSNCYTSPSFDNCDTTNMIPRILPGFKALRHQSIATQFAISRKLYSQGFGFSEDTTNSHMMKNSEWGAAAYLSHSIYGLNREVRINNSSLYTTGCGAGVHDYVSVAGCEIEYGNGEVYYPQSTTGNISGIFDMAGGAWENVMANYQNELALSEFTSMPQAKYYDYYESYDCKITGCGGHALFETAGWYNDYYNFAHVDAPWFRRSGGYSDTDRAGLFYSIEGGNKQNVSGWRSVVIIGYAN